jgi:hypothetical protein
MSKVDDAPGPAGRKVCCLISEMLEEMGLDSRKARQIRRQTLLGLMTFCQWQLARIDAQEQEKAPGARPRGRRVKVR